MKKKEKERLEEIRYLLKDSELHFSEDYKSNHSEEAALEEEMWELEGKEDLASLDNLIEKQRKEEKIEKVYGYRRCLFCKETIFSGYAYRRKYGKRKRYFDSKNCLIGWILDRINIEMDLKDWTLMLSIKDYWNRPKIKEAIDRRINRNYEKVFIQNIKGGK